MIKNSVEFSTIVVDVGFLKSKIYDEYVKSLAMLDDKRMVTILSKYSRWIRRIIWQGSMLTKNGSKLTVAELYIPIWVCRYVTALNCWENCRNNISKAHGKKIGGDRQNFAQKFISLWPGPIDKSFFWKNHALTRRWIFFYEEIAPGPEGPRHL